MPKPILIAAVLVIAALACSHAPPRARATFTPIPEAEAAAVANPHDHAGAPLCQRCHDPAKPDARVDSIGVCSKCHPYMRHPYGIPEKDPAVGVPLVDGKIVCHSCHDPHDVKARPHGLRMGYLELCQKCHPERL